MSASDAILIAIIGLLVLLLATIPVLIRRGGSHHQRRKPGGLPGKEIPSAPRLDDISTHSGGTHVQGQSGLEPGATHLEEKQDLQELVGGPARKNGRPH